MFDCVIMPSQLPRRLRSSTPPLLLLFPGIRSRPTQTIPCWAANNAIDIRELSLSPCCAPELVKPAATLSRHFMRVHAALVESSKNFFNLALIIPL
ncbi:hypothetical protein XHC_0484 [Xanthomonas hortorum pv. carotae str. M081]|nr:hypothetical protein XHC_0484 [Xanthomonas hortorum pv. carotae str. M081]